jgi:hypothetical protein
MLNTIPLNIAAKTLSHRRKTLRFHRETLNFRRETLKLEDNKTKRQ